MMAFVSFALFVAALAFVIWKVHKSHTEAALARRTEVAKRRKQAKKVVTPELDMTWPVIIRPATGEGAAGEDSEAEPSMTAIEYEPPKQAAS
jgi:hypothetical protein